MAKVKKNERVVVGYQQQTIIAIVRFRPIEQYTLLTGMLVVPDHRQQGIGQQLLSYCATEELNSNCYCFAYQHLETFYQQGGFHAIESEQLPSSLRQLFLRYITNGKKLLPMQYKSVDMA
ncbi:MULTISPECIES: GNAT family N-acetyltransferase [Vibrio]|uniref:GNAT family N-acetyltransferase n=1 Tax=Vibrio TaxID=662 RepID=UPI001EEE46C1|nr:MULTISPECIES: GNAT family N-acetyltransferase [Vibrio]